MKISLRIALYGSIMVWCSLFYSRGAMLAPLFNSTNNNLISPTNLTFVDLNISNAALVTNVTSFINWAKTGTGGGGSGGVTNNVSIVGTGTGIGLNITTNAVTNLVYQLNSVDYLSGPNAPVANVIWDLDPGQDIDDGFDLAIIFQLEALGYIKLLGLTTAITNSYAAPAVEVIARYYNRSTIPIATSKTQTYAGSDTWGTGIINEFGSLMSLNNSTNSPNAVTLARQLLNAAKDGSVTLAYAGQLRNLADLWNSAADTNSPLTGTNLIARKVKEIVVTGGVWPNSNSPGEFNFTSDPTSAAIINSISNVPVRFVGIELVNIGVVIGANIFYQRTTSNPLREAMRLWSDYPTPGSHNPAVGRESWAGLMAMYIALGETTRGTNYFSPGPAGYGVVNSSNGTNSFTTNVVGNQKYFLTLPQVAAVYTNILDGLLMADPLNRQPIIFEAAAGSVTNASLRFRGNITDGFFYPGVLAGGIGFTADNSEWMRFYGYNSTPAGGIAFRNTGRMSWTQGDLGTTIRLNMMAHSTNAVRFSDYTDTNVLKALIAQSIVLGTGGATITNTGTLETRVTSNLIINNAIEASDGSIGNPSVMFESNKTNGWYKTPGVPGWSYTADNKEFFRLFGVSSQRSGGIIFDGTEGGIWWTSNLLASTPLQIGIRKDGDNGLRIADYTSTNSLGFLRSGGWVMNTNGLAITNVATASGSYIWPSTPPTATNQVLVVAITNSSSSTLAWGTQSGGGGGVAGTVINSGTPVTGNILSYSDTTGTNATPVGVTGTGIVVKSTNPSVTNMVRVGRVALGDAATITGLDLSLGENFIVLLGGNRTLPAPTNGKDGQSFKVWFVQDPTGNRTIAFATNYTYGSFVTGITLTTNASYMDAVGFEYWGTNSVATVTSFAPGYVKQ